MTLLVPNDGNWIEVDSSSCLTIDPTTVSIASMAPTDNVYLYHDFGGSTFGNITVQATLNHTSGVSSYAYFLGMSNTLGNNNDLDVATDGIVVEIFRGLGSSIWKITEHVGSSSSAATTALAGATNWYYTFDRTGTTATLTVRATSHTGSVQGSPVTLTVPSTGYRYLYLGQSVGVATGSTISYTMRDIDSTAYPPTIDPTYTINLTTQTYFITPKEITYELSFVGTYNLYLVTQTYIISCKTILLDAFELTTQTYAITTYPIEFERTLVIQLEPALTNLLITTGSLTLIVNPPALSLSVTEILITPGTISLLEGYVIHLATQSFTINTKPLTLTDNQDSLIDEYYSIAGA